MGGRGASSGKRVRSEAIPKMNNPAGIPQII